MQNQVQMLSVVMNGVPNVVWEELMVESFQNYCNILLEWLRRSHNSQHQPEFEPDMLMISWMHCHW